MAEPLGYWRPGELSGQSCWAPGSYTANTRGGLPPPSCHHGLCRAVSWPCHAVPCRGGTEAPVPQRAPCPPARPYLGTPRGRVRCGGRRPGPGHTVPYRTVPGRAVPVPVQRRPPRVPGRPPGRSAWPCGSRCAARPGGTGKPWGGHRGGVGVGRWGQLRPTRVSSVPNRLCPKSAPSHLAAGRGELWGGRGTVPGCLLAQPRRAAGRRWGLSVISSSRIKPRASIAGHRAPCPAWHRGAVGCPGHSGGSGSLVPCPAPRAGGWGWLRGGCSCSITALPGAFSLFFRIQMTLEIEVVKHSCGSHRPVPGSTALFLGIFPARRVDPASLGGTGSCWRGILIPCPVQGSVSAGMNIPMRLVCQKLLDLGKTWGKKTKGEGRGCPSPKKNTKGGSSYGEESATYLLCLKPLFPWPHVQGNRAGCPRCSLEGVSLRTEPALGFGYSPARGVCQPLVPVPWVGAWALQGALSPFTLVVPSACSSADAASARLTSVAAQSGTREGASGCGEELEPIRAPGPRAGAEALVSLSAHPPSFVLAGGRHGGDGDLGAAHRDAQQGERGLGTAAGRWHGVRV